MSRAIFNPEVLKEVQHEVCLTPELYFYDWHYGQNVEGRDVDKMQYAKEYPLGQTAWTDMQLNGEIPHEEDWSTAFLTNFLKTRPLISHRSTSDGCCVRRIRYCHELFHEARQMPDGWI